jgi:hypothetical protein
MKVKTPIALMFFLAVLAQTAQAKYLIVWEDWEQSKTVYYSQPAQGGPKKPATPAEKTYFLQREKKTLPLRSPDGKYEIASRGSWRHADDTTAIARNIKRDKTTFRVRHLPEGFSGDQIWFQGWLPTSDLMTLTSQSHDSTGEEYDRVTIDLETKKPILFNGWISPYHNIAIVPAKTGVVSGTETHDYGDKIYTEDQMAFYLVKPVDNLRRYNFKASKPRLIHFDKNTKAGVSLLVSSADFSPDGRWAILGNYCIDLTQAKARKLSRFASERSFIMPKK